MTEPPEDDPLAALRERLERTQEAVERLAAETAAARAENGRGPSGAPPQADDAATEAQALTALLHTVRDVIPEELWRQLSEVIRQLLLLLRATLDWWIERLPSPLEPAEPVVQDIPIN